MADDNEISLPKATVQKLIKEYVHPDLRVAGDMLDAMMGCCTEFIQLLSSEANEFATKENKNTIHPDHVIRALQELGFAEFVGEVTATWDQYKEDTKFANTQKANLRKTGAEQAGLTEEEQIALQQQMFAAARAQSMTSVEAAALMQHAYQQQLGMTGSVSSGGIGGQQQQQPFNAAGDPATGHHSQGQHQHAQLQPHGTLPQHFGATSSSNPGGAEGSGIAPKGSAYPGG